MTHADPSKDGKMPEYPQPLHNETGDATPLVALMVLLVVLALCVGIVWWVV